LAGALSWSEFGYVASRSDPAALNEPQSVAADGAGHVFVVNTFGNDANLYSWNGSAYVFDPAFLFVWPLFCVLLGVALFVLWLIKP
jgi:hypothetical protein